MKTLVVIAMIVALPATAFAFQCPVLQKEIEKHLGNRFDATASSAKQLAAQGDALHKAGNHAESVKKYEEAMKSAKIEPPKK
jgi:hypothetical protein